MAVCPASAAPTGSEVKWYTGTARCEQIPADTDDVTALGFSLASTAEYGIIEVYDSDNNLLTVGQCKTNKDTAATESTGCDFIYYADIENEAVYTVYYVDIGTALAAIANAQDINSSLSADTDSQAIAGEYRKKQAVGASDQTMTVNQLFVTETFLRSICGDNYTDATTSTTLVVNSSHKTTFNAISAIIGKRLDSSGRIQRKWGYFDVKATSLAFNNPVSAGQANINATFNVGYMLTAEWSYAS